MKKIDELKNHPRDPTTPESLEIKRKFWEDLDKGLQNIEYLIKQWIEEDEDQRNNR